MDKEKWDELMDSIEHIILLLEQMDRKVDGLDHALKIVQQDLEGLRRSR